MKKTLWIITILFATLIGIFSFYYTYAGANAGFLELKQESVIKSKVWWAFLYTHMMSGGFAIVLGWVQFWKKTQEKYVLWHRRLGMVYVGSALICALSGLYIGFYATGGWIPALGFISVALIYFYTTLMGLLSIRNNNIRQHQRMMTYSYSVCLAAVTLRIYIPLSFALNIDYILAYSFIAWLSWIPNLLVAWWVNKSRV